MAIATQDPDKAVELVFRADEPCDAPLTMIDPDNPPTPNPLRLLAPEILALDVQFICSTGDTVDRFPDSNCEAPDGYARSAVVTVIVPSFRKAP